MTEINVIVTGPEEAYNNEAEFWCANEQMGVTVLHEGRLHLRIDPRADGSPWLADVASLARALAEAEQRLAAYCTSADIEPNRKDVPHAPTIVLVHGAFADVGELGPRDRSAGGGRPPRRRRGQSAAQPRL